MIPSPDALAALASRLDAAAATVRRIGAGIAATAADSAWTGGAADAYAGRVRGVVARLERQAGRLTGDAAAARRLAADLADELARLRRAEHAVLGALSRLGSELVTGASAEVHAIYHEVRAALPPSGSPEWPRLADRLGAAR